MVHCNPADARVIFKSSQVAFFNDTNTFCFHSEIEHVLPASLILFTHLGVYVWSANDLETSFLHAPHTGLSAETKLNTNLRVHPHSSRMTEWRTVCDVHCKVYKWSCHHCQRRAFSCSF